MGRKAVSEMIGGVLFIAISVSAVVLVMHITGPRIAEMKDMLAIDQAKDMLASLDRVVRDVASAGPGSTRILPVEIKGGQLIVDGDNNMVYYDMTTNADVVSPRSRRRIGNLWFSSNTNVSVYNDSGHFYLENEHLLVNISRYGSSSAHVSMSPDYLIDGIYFKDRSQAMRENVTIHIDGAALSGAGYNYAEEAGRELARGRIVNFFNTTSCNYTVYISLESGEDFFQIQVVDIVDKS